MLSQFAVDFYMSIIILCYVGLETPLKIYGNLKGWVKGCIICYLLIIFFVIYRAKNHEGSVGPSGIFM